VPGVLHVLCDVDRLSATALEGFLTELSDGPVPLFAATAATHPAVLAIFRGCVTVPPLRHRTADLAELVRALLAELAPHREVRLSVEATRMLARYGWPGNVRELREVLAGALARRPVGVIEAHDLPARCQSSPRSVLRPVDEVERDAIVAALREAAGNRKAAAAALGLARSTLYRKLRQYGISD
jgi:sigma-54 dependent transcriptional regulator, acetoin dehydrogenase operon transcriptional activator AcoR